MYLLHTSTTNHFLLSIHLQFSRQAGCPPLALSETRLVSHAFCVTLACLLSMASCRFLSLLFCLFPSMKNAWSHDYSLEKPWAVYKWTFITLQLLLVALVVTLTFHSSIAQVFSLLWFLQNWLWATGKCKPNLSRFLAAKILFLLLEF